MAFEYYDILWVSKTASIDELKKAYRKKAMDSHPDRHGGDKEKEAQFKKINEAYAVLSDEQKRAHYDRFGTMDNAGGFGGGQGGFDVNFDISDIFESFFGGGAGGFGGGNGRRKKEEAAEPIELKLKLTFAEAILGTKKIVEFSKKIICQDCEGTGAKEGSKVDVCWACGGAGHVMRRVQTLFGMMEKSQICETCNGNGKIIHEKCSACRGTKRVNEVIKKEIEIPAGIDDAITLRFSGEGSEGVDGSKADLYVHISCPDNFEGLTREDADLYYTIELDPYEAVLGGKKKIKVPIIGERTLDLKAGLQHGDVIKLRGDGVKHLQRDMRGDLLISLHIRIPKNVSAKEKALYEMIAQSRTGDKKTKGLLDTIFGEE